MKKDNKYKLAVFEDEDKADLVEYSKQMQKSIEKALDENQGEKGEKGDKGDKGDKGELVDLVKEEEGKNISIESANLPAIEVSIEGESQQTTRSGKNHFDASQIPSSTNIVVSDNGKTITMPIVTSGVGYISTTKKLSELCPKLKVGDIATLRFNRNLGNTYNNFIYLSGISLIWEMNASKKITQEMLDNYVALYANRYNDGETGQCILTDFSIMLSSETDTSWEPYGASPSPDYRSPIENIEGNIEIKDEGKNLYAGNGITINGTYSSNTSVNLGSRYLSEGTYTISLVNSLPNNCYIYLGANGSIAYDIKDKATFTLTKGQNVPIRLIAKAGTYSNFTTKIMIEKGKVVTDYEPHQQQTEYFPLSEGQKLMEGSYLADDGIHHVRKQVVLTGTENWNLYLNKTKTFKLSISPWSYSGVCTHYQGIISSSFDVKTGIYLSGSAMVVISDPRFSTVEEFKTYLAEQYSAGTPVTFEYIMMTNNSKPVEKIVPYTDGQKEAREKIKNIVLYKGTNHISCTGKLKIKYYTNEEMNEIYAKKEDLHEHANKSILDQTQEAFTTELKNKLDGLNNYVLPAPTSTTLGGVKAGSNITIDVDGTINAQLGSGGETSANNYEDLSNKPQIAGITLQGNKSLADLGIQASSGELGTDNLNTKKISGIYAQSTATNFLKSRNYPFDHADGFPFFDILLEVKNAGMYIMQELHLSYKISVQGQEVISYFTYMRFSTNNGSTWSAWRGHEGTTTQ